MPQLIAPDAKELRKEEDRRLLPLIDETADALAALAQDLGVMDDKLRRQHDWLNAHRKHPKWDERFAAFTAFYAERDDVLTRFYKLAAKLDRQTDHLSAAGRIEANAARPGISDGITWARRIRYQHSPAWGLWLDLTEEPPCNS
jgi:hypothetical protein